MPVRVKDMAVQNHVRLSLACKAMASARLREASAQYLEGPDSEGSACVMVIAEWLKERRPDLRVFCRRVAMRCPSSGTAKEAAGLGVNALLTLMLEARKAAMHHAGQCLPKKQMRCPSSSAAKKAAGLGVKALLHLVS